MIGWLQDWWGGIRAGSLLRRHRRSIDLESLRFTASRSNQESLDVGIGLTAAAWRARQRRGL